MWRAAKTSYLQYGNEMASLLRQCLKEPLRTKVMEKNKVSTYHAVIVSDGTSCSSLFPVRIISKLSLQSHHHQIHLVEKKWANGVQQGGKITHKNFSAFDSIKASSS